MLCRRYFMQERRVVSGSEKKKAKGQREWNEKVVRDGNTNC